MKAWIYLDADGVERVIRADSRAQAERFVLLAEAERGVVSIAARQIAARSVREEQPS